MEVDAEDAEAEVVVASLVAVNSVDDRVKLESEDLVLNVVVASDDPEDVAVTTVES